MFKTKNSSRTTQVFDDLDRLRKFCVEYGYRFDEADLYNQRSYVYRQLQKKLAGKPVKDQWQLDGDRFKGINTENKEYKWSAGSRR